MYSAWPDCSNVGNTTELQPQQSASLPFFFLSLSLIALVLHSVWTECKYVTRDGQFNPDGRVVNNVGDFDMLANAILFNSLAWALSNGNDTYAARVAKYVDAWFLNPDTFMNPNLNYAQMERGVGGQVGTHTGIL